MNAVLSFLKALGDWLLNVLLALDQFINVVFLFGYPDETISSRCWRRSSEGSPVWTLARKGVDALAWLIARRTNHCQQAFMSERMRYQEPPELRDGNG